MSGREKKELNPTRDEQKKNTPEKIGGVCTLQTLVTTNNCYTG